LKCYLRSDAAAAAAAAGDQQSRRCRYMEREGAVLESEGGERARCERVHVCKKRWKKHEFRKRDTQQ